uniref:Lipocalin/cytosolic fatty-acid binding domain-containing protein n=1 Tax=Clastoptera arizonana TaxID=38151 RepID=A0A1B6CM03_9HEMI
MCRSILLFFGCVYVAYGRDCIHPEVLANPDLNKLGGDWYELAYTSANESLLDDYKDTSCVKLNYKPNDDGFDVSGSYKEEGKSETIKGTYKMADKSKALFDLNFPDEPEYNDYKYHYLCTDYTNYLAGYSSNGYQKGDGLCSEYVVVAGRDPSKMPEVMANEHLKKCLSDKVQTEIGKLKAISQIGCN